MSTATNVLGTAVRLIRTVTLSDAERRGLAQALDFVEGSPYGASIDDFMESLSSRTGAALPPLPRVLEMIRAVATDEIGVLQVRGLPVRPLDRATPTVPYHQVTDKLVGTEKCLLFFASLLGPPIGFSDWHQGDRIQNLYPVPELRFEQCASNSVYLEMHTETAFRESTPRYVLLLCLRRDPRETARTLLCDLAGAIRSLDDTARDALRLPKFCFEAKGTDSPTKHTEPKPIDTVWKGRRRLNFAEALVAIDASSDSALSALKTEIRAGTVEVDLHEGDLLIINNLFVVHGRTVYAPRYDGTDRWLQRVLV